MSRKAMKLKMLSYHLKPSHHEGIYEHGATQLNSRLFQFECPVCKSERMKGYKFKTRLQRERDHFTECDNCKTTYRIKLPDIPFEAVSETQGEMF